MRIWFEEFASNYTDYAFSYKVFLEKDTTDVLSVIYDKGFLPMSKDGIKNTFYQARSFRVDLAKFEETSENRRVLRKFENGITREVIPISRFDVNDESFKEISQTYLGSVHNLDGKSKVTFLFDSELVTDVVVYKDNGTPIAYVILVQDDEMTHYWFSFFSLSMVKKSFGIWLILREILIAKEMNKKFFYIGTCYGEKGRYKINFGPFEFWDGAKWDGNKDDLKALLEKDSKA